MEVDRIAINRHDLSARKVSRPGRYGPFPRVESVNAQVEFSIEFGNPKSPHALVQGKIPCGRLLHDSGVVFPEHVLNI